MARTRIPHEVDDAIIEENTKGRPEMTIFAKTLNRLLVENGIHQDELAQALGISSGSISSYRRGEKEPRFTMIVKIADYLGVDCDYLMTGVRAEHYSVANELGLSGGAIKYLQRAVGTHYENRRIVLNALLENYDFYHLLGIIYECSEAIGPREEIFKIPIDDRFPNHSSKEIFEALAVNWTAKVVSSTVEILKGERETNGKRQTE